MKKWFLAALAVFSLPIVQFAAAQEIDWKTYDPKKATPEEVARVERWLSLRPAGFLGKTTGSMSARKSVIMRGNKITTIVYNTGTITRPNTLSGTADLVWNRLGYGFEFTPLVGGEVRDVNGDTVHILNDGMYLPSQGGYSPDNLTLKWGWLPKEGYADPTQADIAAWSHRSDVQGDLTRKPHSWPESFFNATLGRYVWPAYLGADSKTPDEEVYFVCDDWSNQKYLYYPFPGDSTKRGLGLDMEVRFFQYNNPQAEDIIFLVYRVTNKSPKDIGKVYFGMYGDPHIGGSTDYGDDLAYFIPPRGELADPYSPRARSMVYAWDKDMKGEGSLPAGYFGFKFLESPTNSSDGIDNDDDGITDESPFNDAGTYVDGLSRPLTTGISDTAKYLKMYGKIKARWSGDENGNWDPASDDVGLDGIPGTSDAGEGNGRPDVGFDANNNFTSEPNFGIRDVNESDQIGLTSFYALGYTNSVPNVPKNDVYFWQLISSDSIAIDQTLFSTAGDNIFVYGSGKFALNSLGTQRFSIALMMGMDLNDLLLNAETAQRILESNYRFAQPPPKPIVKAVPGDGRVTLYWDNSAENTVDPLTMANDFEGYKIYRSEDFTFADVFSITDANGNPFLGKPMQQNGVNAQFDLVDAWSGLHPVEYLGRGIKYQLGSNTGLVHSFVDSSVANGKTYYYAVVSYDYGFDSLGIQLPPTECQTAITQDPITKVLSFDINTVAATPNALPAGLQKANFTASNGIQHVSGSATGDISIRVFNDLIVQDALTYNIDFAVKGGKVVYDIYPLVHIKEKITSRDTLYVNLTKKNVMEDSVIVRDAAGTVVAKTKYYIDGEGGRIKGLTGGALPAGSTYEVEYTYYSMVNSVRMNSEDDNPVFDGMRPFVKNYDLEVDSVRSAWLIAAKTNLKGVSGWVKSVVTKHRQAPYDFNIVWNKTDRDSRGKWLYPGDTLLNNSLRKVVVCPFRVVNLTDQTPMRILVTGATDSVWKPGREIVFLTPTAYAGGTANATMFGLYFNAPTTGDTVYPSEGDVYQLKTNKPFAAGDRYRFTTTAAKLSTTSAKTGLDNVYVVPNPYVATNMLETPGATSTTRGSRRVQFRGLPPVCTIRIYTMVGELVQTLSKNDMTNYCDWDLLSYEGHRIAYGVYIYHVDAPGIGEKIGRLAIIK